jgi:hypothetical protein
LVLVLAGQPGAALRRLGRGSGLCSYLLIGFWYEVEANAVAGKKALS